MPTPRIFKLQHQNKILRRIPKRGETIRTIDDYISAGLETGFLQMCKDYQLDKNQAKKAVIEFQQAGRIYTMTHRKVDDYTKAKYQYQQTIKIITETK